jgi:peptidoglycan/xylan/chitin deacetylase (PgdA/CDA1 family)
MEDFPRFEFSWGKRTMLGLNTPSQLYEIWTEEFSFMYENVDNGVMTIVMHPQVMGRGHRILFLERFIQFVKKKPKVWITTLEDVAKTWQD